MTAELISRMSQMPGGRRLLALIADPKAEKHRRARGRRRIDGSLGDLVWLTGDALVDVAHGREPRRWTLAAADVGLLGVEVRRRLTGNASIRHLQGAAHIIHRDDDFEVRVLDAWMIGALAAPVCTLHVATLVLDGPHAGTLAGPGVEDLRTGLLQAVDPEVFERRPEALVTLARLAVRPELRLSGQTAAAARSAFADGWFDTVRQSRLWFALSDLLDAPEAIEALELLRDLSAPRPLHESAEVDGDLLRRASALLPAGASLRKMLLLGVLRDAHRSRVRAFTRMREIAFDGPEARAVIAAAGPTRRPRWA